MLLFSGQMKIFSFLLVYLLPLCAVAQHPDIDLLRTINLDRNTSLDGSMKLLSNTEAYIGTGLPLGVCLAAWIKHDGPLLEKGMNMTLALAVNSVHTYALKHIIDRPRPDVSYPEIDAYRNERHYSFPSGHTSNAFVTATALSLNFRKWYVVVPAYAWACGVGYSRMHLGMHYPSDVLGGALLGAGSAWITYQANRRLKAYFEHKYAKPMP